MKTLFFSITVAILLSNTAFAGWGTLFKDGIGLADWAFNSSLFVKSDSAVSAATKTRQLGRHLQSWTNSKQTGHRVATQ
jgi:hypothetical protein